MWETLLSIYLFLKLVGSVVGGILLLALFLWACYLAGERGK